MLGNILEAIVILIVLGDRNERNPCDAKIRKKHQDATLLRDLLDGIDAKFLKSNMNAGNMNLQKEGSNARLYKFQAHEELIDFPGSSELVESMRQSAQKTNFYSGRLKHNLTITPEQKEKRARAAIQSLLPWVITAEEQKAPSDLAFLSPFLDLHWKVPPPNFTKLSRPQWFKANPVQKSLFKNNSDEYNSQTNEIENSDEIIDHNSSSRSAGVSSPLSSFGDIAQVLSSGIKLLYSVNDDVTSATSYLSASSGHSLTDQVSETSVYTPDKLDRQSVTFVPYKPTTTKHESLSGCHLQRKPSSASHRITQPFVYACHQNRNQTATLTLSNQWRSSQNVVPTIFDKSSVSLMPKSITSVAQSKPRDVTIAHSIVSASVQHSIEPVSAKAVKSSEPQLAQLLKQTESLSKAPLTAQHPRTTELVDRYIKSNQPEPSSNEDQVAPELEKIHYLQPKVEPTPELIHPISSENFSSTNDDNGGSMSLLLTEEMESVKEKVGSLTENDANMVEAVGLQQASQNNDDRPEQRPTVPEITTNIASLENTGQISYSQTAKYTSTRGVALSSSDTSIHTIPAQPVVEILGCSRLNSRICLICLKLCGTDWELTSHVCSCCICSKSMDRGDVDFHMWKEHQDVMWRCSQCEEAFVLLQHLMLHKRKEHPLCNISSTEPDII